MNHARWRLATNQHDHLVYGGADIVELARQYGTPLHIVDEGGLRGNYRAFVNAFQLTNPEVSVFYSYKTNCVPGVLAILHEEGCGAEVVSPYELWLATRLGVPMSQIIYNGAQKSTDDLSEAIGHGVGLINVDSAGELDRLSAAATALNRRVDVGLRIDPGVGWTAHFGLSLDIDRIAAVVGKAGKNPLLNLCCLHTHVGSGIRDTHDHRKALEVLAWLSHRLSQTCGVQIDRFDVGGGFGVPTVKTFTLRETVLYKLFNRPPSDPAAESCPSLQNFGQMMTAVLRDCCARYAVREPRLLLEPGRALTGNAQILLVSVREIKRRKNGTAYAVTDGGMQNVAFPLSYEYHTCLVANRAGAPRTKRYFVTGPLCSPEDLLYRNWPLPELRQGDLLAIMDAGAYFTSFSNNFSFPRPPVVIVANGLSRLIRRRETFEQMTAVDAVPAPCDTIEPTAILRPSCPEC
jgi:diaminopimelate decarboxylase